MALPASRKSIFDEFFRDFPLGYSIKPLHGDPLPSPGQIRIEVQEDGDNIVVQAEVPGAHKDDIDVSVEGDLLTIKVEIKQHDADREDGQILHSERYYGLAQRSIRLPCKTDQESAKADYRDGLLVLTLPKAAARKSQKIKVG